MAAAPTGEVLGFGPVGWPDLPALRAQAPLLTHSLPGQCHPGKTQIDALSGSQCWCDTVGKRLALRTEYATSSDILPDSLRDSATAQALRAIVDLDIDELAAIVPPHGHGRD